MGTKERKIDCVIAIVCNVFELMRNGSVTNNNNTNRGKETSDLANEHVLSIVINHSRLAVRNEKIEVRFCV